jgi:hypothetical protein
VAQINTFALSNKRNFLLPTPTQNNNQERTQEIWIEQVRGAVAGCVVEKVFNWIFPLRIKIRQDLTKVIFLEIYF